MVSASKDSKGSLQLPKAATSATISSRRQSTLLTAIKQGESWQFYSIWYMKPLCGDIPWNLTLVGRFLLTLLTQIISEKKDLQELADIYSVFHLFPACHIASLAGGGGRASDRLSQALHRPIWHPGVATGDLGDFVAVSFGPEISSVNSTMNILYRYFWYMYMYIYINVHYSLQYTYLLPNITCSSCTPAIGWFYVWKCVRYDDTWWIASLCRSYGEDSSQAPHNLMCSFASSSSWTR